MFYNKEKLSIQFIYGRLSAEVTGGSEVRVWESKEFILEAETLHSELCRIPKELKFRGEEVSLVAATPSIDFLVLKTPPMKSKELEQFLARKAHTTKGETHIWGYTSLRVVNKEDNIYLHLVPEVYRTVFLQFCDQLHFQPVFLMTLASISPLLLEMEKGDGLELVAAATGESTFIVVGQKNNPFLIREVPYSWINADEANIERLGREIIRTALFTKQQHNRQITTVRLLGKDAEKARGVTSALTEITLEVVEEDVRWFRFLYTLKPYRTENLIPRKIVGHNKRRRMTLFMFGAVMLFLLAAISLEIFYQVLSQNVDRVVKNSNVNECVIELTNQKLLLEKQKAEILANNGLSDLIARLTYDPIPGWFCGYASDKLSDELSFSRMSVVKDSLQNSWYVELEGVAPRNSVKAAKILNAYQSELCNAPVNLVADLPWRFQWIENLKKGASQDSDLKGKLFRIYGRIR